MFTKNGGNQEVTCDNIDSEYLKQQIISKYERLVFVSGKDTFNRFNTKDYPIVAVVGRSGYSETSPIPRGALI